MTSAVLAGLGYCSAESDAADVTFNAQLYSPTSRYNPLQAQFGMATENYYADFGTNGTLLGLGTIEGTAGGTGVVFMDITNPSAMAYRSWYNPIIGSGGLGVRFQDVIIRNNIAYCAIDDSGAINGGIHILDVSTPTSPVKIAELTQASNGHFNNHTITLDGNFLYAQNNVTTTVKVFDVTNPAAPTFVRNIVTTGTSSTNVHDANVKNGRLYTSNIDTGLLEIYNVSDVSSPSWSTATRLVGSFNPGTRNHSSAVTDDGRYVVVARETSNGDVQIWDTLNLADGAIATMNRTSLGIDAFTPHNPVIVGETLYVSWYQAGVQIFNIRNPASPVHLGAFDTFAGGVGAPGPYLSSYDGNWGVNPTLGYDRILLSDFDSGITVVNATEAFRKEWTYAADNGKWQESSRWDGGAGPIPNSSDMIAAFTDPAAGTTRTVTVDHLASPARPRVAAMHFSSGLSYTINGASGGDVELLSYTGPARISVSPGSNSGTNVINVPLVLSDDLVVTNNSAKITGTSLDIALITGAGRSLTFEGPGQTGLVGASPGFTGFIYINNGYLVLRHAQATNAQPISLQGGNLSLRANAGTNFASDVAVLGDSTIIANNNGSGSGFTHSLGDVTAEFGTLTIRRNQAISLVVSDLIVNSPTTVFPMPMLGGALRAGTLSIYEGTKLNLNSSNLIVDGDVAGGWNGSAYTGVIGMVASGRGNGTWNGNGIVTAMSDATGSLLTTLAAASAGEALGLTGGQTALWCGQTVDALDTLVMYTWGGDADFDGDLDGDDYFAIDSNIGQSGSVFGYARGDFDYDGVIDGDDYFIIDSNIATAQSSSPFPTGAAGGLAVVPEPAGIAGAMVALGVGWIRRSRRRR